MKTEKESLGRRIICCIRDNIKMRIGYEDNIDPDMYLDKDEPVKPFVLPLKNMDSIRKLIAFKKKHMAECGSNSALACFSYNIDVTTGGDFWKVSCPCGAYIELEGNFSTF